MSPFGGGRKGGAARPRPAPDDTAPVRDNGLFHLLRGPATALARRTAAFGADPEVCEIILLTRLRLDMRGGGLRTANKPEGGGLAMTCLMFTINGLLVALAALFLPADGTRIMALVQSALAVVIGMLLVSDYLAMLLDPAEADLIASRPVSGRTLLVARLLHLGLYLLVPVLSFLTPVWIAGFLREDSLAWLLMLPVISMLTTTLVVSALLVGFVALVQRLDGERLGGMLVKAQIVSSFVVFGVYYLGMGLVQNETSRAWIVSDHPLQLLLPPYWFGGLFGVMTGRVDVLAKGLATLALLVPLGMLAGLLWRAGPRLVTGLASIRTGAGEVQRRDGPIRRLAGRLVQPGLERAGFDLFASLSTREQGFRSRVYPMLVLPFIMFVWMALEPDHMGGQLYIWSSLIPLLYAILILYEVRHSDTPGGSWVFASAPVEAHGLVLSGVVKALVFAFLLPWIALVLLAAAFMSADLPIMDVLFGTVFAMSVTLLAARKLTTSAFPFSRPFVQRSGQQTGLVFFSMLVLGVLAFVQHLLGGLDLGLELATVVLLPVVYWQMRTLRTLRVDPRSIPPVT